MNEREQHTAEQRSETGCSHPARALLRSRLRGEALATFTTPAGVTAELGGTLGIALTPPAVNLALSMRGVVIAGCVAIAVAVGGSLYAQAPEACSRRS